jgi:hypothetical protein
MKEANGGISGGHVSLAINFRILGEEPEGWQSPEEGDEGDEGDGECKYGNVSYESHLRSCDGSLGRHSGVRLRAWRFLLQVCLGSLVSAG